MKKILMALIIAIGFPLASMNAHAEITLDQALQQLNEIASLPADEQDEALEALMAQAGTDGGKALILGLAASTPGINANAISLASSRSGVTAATITSKSTSKVTYQTSTSTGGSGGSSINEVTLSNYI